MANGIIVFALHHSCGIGNIYLPLRISNAVQMTKCMVIQASPNLHEILRSYLHVMYFLGSITTH